MNPISDIESFDLKAGELLKRFRAGAQVICLRNCAQVQQIFDFFVGDAGIGTEFWREDIFNLAENHIAGDFEFGDMCRFEKNQFGHLARKFCFYPDPVNGRFVTHPDFYGDAEMGVSKNPDMLRKVWDLALEIQQCAAETPINPAEYAVKIELLKYPSSAENLEKLFRFIANSESRWSRLGRRIDYAVSTAGGPLGARYVKDLYGILSVMPGFGQLLKVLNEKFCSSDYYSVPKDKILVGPPHTDGDRYLTMLSGKRNVMTTEFFADGNWIEIPVEPTSLSILPTRMYERSMQVPATVHRYLIDRSDTMVAKDSPNVTFLIGVIPRDRVHHLT